MQVHRAIETEVPELCSLVIAAKAHWGYSVEQISTWRTSLEVSAETISSYPTFVGEMDGQIVGCYSLVPSPQAWELDHLWVHPRFMRRGYGRALLAHAIQTAANGGAMAINIDADPNAEPFYLACGAERVDIVAAPIPGQSTRVRPQLVLDVRQPDISIQGAAFGGS